MTEAGNSALAVQVWTMATAGLTEASVAPWAAVLDAAERARAARFAFAPSRIGFIAAHALARAALAALAGSAPQAFGFAAGAHGKPLALLGGRPAGIAFSLSHTDGLVGVALAPMAALPLGLDLEPRDRRAPLQVARRWFTPRELAWLKSLPAARRGEGFFRLWTLKEAFIKATGNGLSQNLASFGFEADPPRIFFVGAAAERAQDWWFTQRVVPGGFLAALGLRAAGAVPEVTWRQADPGRFDPQVPLDGAG